MRFLFVDRVVEYSPHERIQAQLAFPRTLDWPVGRPDGPGPSSPLLLEAMAQAGGWLIKASSDFAVLGVMSLIRGFRCVQPLPTVLRGIVEVQRYREADGMISMHGRITSAHAGVEIASVEAIGYISFKLNNPSLQEWERRTWAIMRREFHIAAPEEPR